MHFLKLHRSSPSIIPTDPARPAPMRLARLLVRMGDAAAGRNGPGAFRPAGNAQAGSADSRDQTHRVKFHNWISHFSGADSNTGSVTRSKEAKALGRLIGRKNMKQLVASFSHWHDLAEVQKERLRVEAEKITIFQKHIDGLRNRDLGSIADVPAAFDGTCSENAVAWILNASASVSANRQVDFAEIVDHYARGNQDLTDLRVIDEIHASLVPRMKVDSRHISSGCREPLSDVSGRKMLQRHLHKLREEPVHAGELGEHLFAGVVGYHAYPDGNGRTGRAVYAIDKLRKQAFERLSIARENALSGLGDKVAAFNPIVVAA